MAKRYGITTITMNYNLRQRMFSRYAYSKDCNYKTFVYTIARLIDEFGDSFEEHVVHDSNAYCPANDVKFFFSLDGHDIDISPFKTDIANSLQKLITRRNLKLNRVANRIRLASSPEFRKDPVYNVHKNAMQSYSRDLQKQVTVQQHKLSELRSEYPEFSVNLNRGHHGDFSFNSNCYRSWKHNTKCKKQYLIHKKHHKDTCYILNESVC